MCVNLLTNMVRLFILRLVINYPMAITYMYEHHLENKMFSHILRRKTILHFKNMT